MGIWDKIMGRNTLEEVAGSEFVDVDVDRANSGDFIDAVGQFGVDLMAMADSNVVCSPFSIYEAWVRVWAAAQGETLLELEQALEVWGGEEPVRSALSKAHDALLAANDEQCDIRVANALWIRHGLPIEVDYEATWGGSTREIDFSKAAEAAELVNAWVSENTNGMIPMVLSERDITPDLAIILANAVSLKAKWETEFAPSSTWEREFELTDGEVVSIPTMHLKSEHGYAAAKDFELLIKPYRGGGAQFVLVLPRKGRFDHVRSRLTYAAVRAAVEKAQVVEVMLRLPKFSVSSGPDVDRLLKARGARSVFHPSTADLSRLSSQAREPGAEIYISRTVHIARIDLDETGTEAAAVTVLLGPAGAAPGEPPIEFTVDRPFLYFVSDRTTAIPLFAGQVLDPRG